MGKSSRCFPSGEEIRRAGWVSGLRVVRSGLRRMRGGRNIVAGDRDPTAAPRCLQFVTTRARLCALTRRLRVRYRSPVLLGLLSCCGPAVAADDDLAALREVVETACSCAAAQSSGMSAAASCTEGPRAFGTLKVNARGAWSEAQRVEADTLERVIETCIANALDHTTARMRLGLAATPGPTGAAPVVWTQVRAADLGAYPTRLARIHAGTDAPLKGLVESVTGDSVMLRRARRDGGGSTKIPLGQIREAWIMAVPEASPRVGRGDAASAQTPRK